jgi:pantothenate kinase type III
MKRKFASVFGRLMQRYVQNEFMALVGRSSIACGFVSQIVSWVHRSVKDIRKVVDRRFASILKKLLGFGLGSDVVFSLLGVRCPFRTIHVAVRAGTGTMETHSTHAQYKALSITGGIGLISVPSSCSIFCRLNRSSIVMRLMARPRCPKRPLRPTRCR